MLRLLQWQCLSPFPSVSRRSVCGNTVIQFHGAGSYTDRYGSVYKGSFVNGKKEGIGRIVHTNGDVYEGQWAANAVCVVIVVVIAEISFFVFIFHLLRFVKSRRGLVDIHVPLLVEFLYRRTRPQRPVDNASDYLCAYASISRFIEQHLMFDQPHGVGTCSYSDKSKYDGNWVHGRRSGSGTLTRACGDIYEGEWEDDLVRCRCAVGQCGVEWCADGLSQFHGNGVMIYGSGLRVDGKWVHGKLLDGSKVTVTHGNLEKPIVVVVEDGVLLTPLGPVPVGSDPPCGDMGFAGMM